jgi:hypothetical protein
MTVQLEFFGFVHYTPPVATELQYDAVVRDGLADHLDCAAISVEPRATGFVNLAHSASADGSEDFDSSTGRCHTIESVEETEINRGAIFRSDPARRNYQTRSSFFGCYRVHLDCLGLGVQCAYYLYFFTDEFFRRPLVAQRVEFNAVIQTVQRAMGVDAGHGALGIRRPHSHLGVICFRAIIVRNHTIERLLARSCGQRCNYEKIEDQVLHEFPLCLISATST